MIIERIAQHLLELLNPDHFEAEDLSLKAELGEVEDDTLAEQLDQKQSDSTGFKTIADANVESNKQDQSMSEVQKEKQKKTHQLFSQFKIHRRGLRIFFIGEVVFEHECWCVFCDLKVVESHIEAIINHVKAKEIAKSEQEKTQAIKDAYAMQNKNFIQQKAHKQLKRERMNKKYQEFWNEALEEARHQIREKEREQAKTFWYEKGMAENQRILGVAARAAPPNLPS